jgi:hypothetical protein
MTGPAQHAVGEMGSPPLGLPPVVARRRAQWVPGACTRPQSRSLETWISTPMEAASPLGAMGHRPASARGSPPRQASRAPPGVEQGAMTSRTNHRLESQEQVGPMPLLLSALPLRRQGAIERSLAGEPMEAICRERGGSKSWWYQWKKRSEASKPDWFQERSRRPRSTPTQTSKALARASVHVRDSLARGESHGVSAQGIREHLGRHYGEPLPSRRTLSRILKRYPRR